MTDRPQETLDARSLTVLWDVTGATEWDGSGGFSAELFDEFVRGLELAFGVGAVVFAIDATIGLPDATVTDVLVPVFTFVTAGTLQLLVLDATRGYSVPDSLSGVASVLARYRGNSVSLLVAVGASLATTVTALSLTSVVTGIAGFAFYWETYDSVVSELSAADTGIEQLGVATRIPIRLEILGFSAAFTLVGLVGLFCHLL